jgi:phosphate transport system substrate-binding protein
MRYVPVLSLAAIHVFGPATLALADEVTLSSPDGLVSLVGELVFYDDTGYLIQVGEAQFKVARELVNCFGATCPEIERRDADIVLRGSDTLGEELIAILIDGYATEYSLGISENVALSADTVQFVVNEEYGEGDEFLVFEVQAAGSTTGMQALIDDQTDIAMSSRPANPEEIARIADQGRGNLLDINQDYVVGVDSIVVIVSPENPVDSISLTALADIYSGRITNWAQLGGSDLPIRVYSRPEASGTRGVFESKVFLRGETLLPGASVVSSNSDIREGVVADPAAIGYVSSYSVLGAKPLDLVLSCGIAIPATDFAAKAEEYPLERRLRLYTDNSPRTEHMQDFLEYAISTASDGLIRKGGFIDLGVTIDADALDARLFDNSAAAEGASAVRVLSEMEADLRGAVRLSTTFRFLPGSSQLDNKAQRDIRRLIDFLALPENAGKEVILVGFTDSVGSFAANLNLAQSRAAVALEAIRFHPDSTKVRGVAMRSTGYGELAPVGCNDTFDGRDRNRRVEVWLR